jgi:lipoprotein-releasing system permease protein
MKLSVNYRIALTHLRTRKKQTLVAALGVTVGIALFIFSNSIVVGVGDYSKKSLFKSVPHLRIYSEDKISTPLQDGGSALRLISNPQFTRTAPYLQNPNALITAIRRLPFVTHIAPIVTVDAFYTVGNRQLKGVVNGIDAAASDAMFDIRGTLLAGDLNTLATDPNSIAIGKGIAERLNIRLNDHIEVLSPAGVRKRLRVAAIFATENKAVDESRSYTGIRTAQNLLALGPGKLTDIYVNIRDPDSATESATRIQSLTSYNVENWETANADQLAQNKMMATMTPLISFSILLVAAFGIYNIINMTVTQKLSEIAILKANGFKGRDVIRIFVSEAFAMGLIGTLFGLLIGALLVIGLSQVYIGPPVGYFPVKLDGSLFLKGSLFGLLVAIGAGYFPARKAGKVDPVTIFRK